MLSLVEFKSSDIVFNTPKPTKLMEKMIQLATNSNTNDIVLDFFAGSGTIGEAVIKINNTHCGNRKFIMVQLPEPIKDDTLHTIADIGKERIRRVITKLEEERDATTANPQTNPASEDAAENSRPDLGFKVFKLHKSNFRVWDGSAAEMSLEKLEEQLSLHVDHIEPGAVHEDILYELLLKAGYMPTAKVERLELAGKTVFAVAAGKLLICLEDAITRELIDAVAAAQPAQFICLDRGFQGNDQLKANAVQTFAALNQERGKDRQIAFRTV